MAPDPMGERPSVQDRQEEQLHTSPRILLVEDEFLLATLLAADLKDAGYEVVGPYSTVAQALAAVQSKQFDAAILDINLKGELVYPVAEELVRRGKPMMFLSGYASINLPENFRSYMRLPKPVDWLILLRQIKSMLGPKFDS